MRKFFQENKALLCLSVILGIAAFFRLWQLGSIPPGLYPDVAMNGNDALDSLKTGDFKIFYPENNGREGLFMWLIALSFSFFGASIWSIKIVAAIIGILTVFGLYLLTKELLNKNVALLSSFLLATSFWHTNFSRIGFRAVLVPLILVFSFYFLFKAFRTKKVQDFIFSGIIFGLGFYTYISFRMAVLILPLILVFYWFVYRKENFRNKYLFFVFCFLFFVFLVALPIGLYFLQNPQDFIGRTSGVSVFSQENPIKAIAQSLILHLGMFNFYGDHNWRHNFPGSPMLFWPIGILFLTGIIISIRNLILSCKKRDYSLFFIPCFLLSWFFIMLLPGILTAEGIPHALRVVGVIPVVYIFAGLGGWNVYQYLLQNTKQKKLLLAATFIFLLTVGVVEFNKYFYKWGQSPEVKNAFSTDYAKIGNYLNSLPDEIQKYVIVNQGGVPVPWPSGLPVPSQTPIFIERTKFGEPRAVYLLPENLDQIQINKKTVIIPMQYEKELFETLQRKFPNGEIKKINEIFTYEIR